MRNRPCTSLLALSVALSFALPSVASAQDAPAPAPAPAAEPEPAPADAITDDEILVIADSLRGQLEVPVPPVLELNEADIAAYGSGSISDLISAMGSSVSGSGGGFPIVLVNGVRISNFRELRSYPPEAIEKVEVFPEEVAQQYGYSPDQRVVNFVLKRNYASRELQGQYGQPWDGGYSTQQVEGTYLQLVGESRLNFNLNWNNSSVLTEAERGVIQSNAPVVPGDPDPAEFRSLVSDSAGIEATGNFATRIATGTSASFNAGFQRNDSLSYQGLNSVVLEGPADENGVRDTRLRIFGEDDPLTVDRRTTTYSFGSALNTGIGDWQINATLDANRADSRSLITRRASPETLAALQAAVDAGTLTLDGPLPDLPDAGFDRADSRSDTANTKVTVNGRPILLPGGEISVTLDGGFDYTNIKSQDTRNQNMEISLKRGDANAGINIGIPITSTREDFGAVLGDISLNLSGGIDHLSDFGTLTDWSAGLNWRPVELLNFRINYVTRDTAPSLSQLGDPEIATLNVPVFDLTRGETVLATVLSGGNTALPARSQRDWRIGADFQLPEFTSAIQQGRFRIEYRKNHSENIASGFPVLTPTIEAAFPGRVVRDPVTGSITQINQRPIALAQQDSEQVQFGLNFTGPFGKPRPEAAAAQQQRSNNPFAMIRQATQGNATPPANGGQGRPRRRDKGRDRDRRKDKGRAPDLVARAADSSIRNGSPRCGKRCAASRAKRPRRSPMPSSPASRRKCWSGSRAPTAKSIRHAWRNCAPVSAAPISAASAAPVARVVLAGLADRVVLAGPVGLADRVDPAGLVVRVVRGGFGGPGGGQNQDGRGRWFVNVNYSYQINNKVLVAEGGPLLDLLDGEALTGGGQPRHSAQVSGGLFYAGYGINANARYTGSSKISGSEAPGSTDLFFADYVTLDLRLFADLNQRTDLIEKVPLLKNTRITFSVNNVFDARQRITDSEGVVPLRYQPFLVDPIGRSISLQLRKLF